MLIGTTRFAKACCGWTSSPARHRGGPPSYSINGVRRSDKVFSIQSIHFHSMFPSQDFRASDDKGVVEKPTSSVDPVHHAKAKLINDALQEIDMGRFQVRSSAPLLAIIHYDLQWHLFIVAGLGWTT